jgi:hypothetical protein
MNPNIWDLKIEILWYHLPFLNNVSYNFHEQ